MRLQLKRPTHQRRIRLQPQHQHVLDPPLLHHHMQIRSVPRRAYRPRHAIRPDHRTRSRQLRPPYPRLHLFQLRISRRPIHHRTADRVRAHILLCMLAYYVEWHMREAWRELMFADTDQAAKATRDPVAPAERSQAALNKLASHTVDDGTPAHSFSTLMAELATIVRNTCRTPRAGPEAPTFDIVTTPNATQRHALDLIKQIRP